MVPLDRDNSLLRISHKRYKQTDPDLIMYGLLVGPNWKPWNQVPEITNLVPPQVAPPPVGGPPPIGGNVRYHYHGAVQLNFQSTKSWLISKVLQSQSILFGKKVLMVGRMRQLLKK